MEVVLQVLYSDTLRCLYEYITSILCIINLFFFFSLRYSGLVPTRIGWMERRERQGLGRGVFFFFFLTVIRTDETGVIVRGYEQHYISIYVIKNCYHYGFESVCSFQLSETKHA